jgi:hypothetical protein
MKELSEMLLFQCYVCDNRNTLEVSFSSRTPCPDVHAKLPTLELTIEALDQ